ncbi:MAG TPA: enolase C-terminal domain-like protein, partial [Candidatus Methylomirabilis sp.]|nr:enolase C-terminal domain-like protein [Candidatus Methylomirabilis sp.]
SVTKVGGISEFRKIIALAQAAGLPIAPHSFYFGPGLAATLHVASSLAGDLPVEFPTGELETPFLTRPIEARDGWVEVPAGPGLGVDVNEEAIRRHPYAAAGAKPFVLT